MLLIPEVFEGASELRVPGEDLLSGEVAGLARDQRLGVFAERDLHVRLDARLADKVAVGGEPLGDAEQDRRAVPEDELGENRPRAEGGLPDNGRPVVVPSSTSTAIGASMGSAPPSTSTSSRSPDASSRT